MACAPEHVLWITRTRSRAIDHAQNVTRPLSQPRTLSSSPLFLPLMPKKPAKLAALFDIRLKNEHDVLVLKGAADDAASSLLSGKIVLSVTEPFSIKKLSLRLYCTLRLNWTETVATSKSSYPKPIRHERKIYEFNWDQSEITKYLNNMYEAAGGAVHQPDLARTGSTASLKSLHLRSKSLSNLTSPSGSFTSLSALGSAKNLNYVLVKGNYEIPFSAILPGNMPESVEGLPGASVVYRIEATIDRGKFHSPMICKRHLRVVRTLTTDSVELSETVAVDNTWPKKVEYSLNVPLKAIAIGSGTPISLMLVPLLKGLKLGEIKISLSEYYSYMGYVPPVHNGERVIAEKVIPRRPDDSAEYDMDKWEVDTFIRVPPSLSLCTQDCDILTNIKVRHKIKFAIGLVNPDGHVSELRASLPVQLFISPFVSVRAGETQEELDDDVLFLPNSLSSLGNMADPSSNSSSYTSFSGLVAPPLYEQHIYDRLWSDVSPVESPVGSGTATPREVPMSGVHELMNMSPIDSVQLNENLRLLSLQRQLESNTPIASGLGTPGFGTPGVGTPGVGTPGSATPGDRATFSLDEPDYFTRRPNLGSRSHTTSFGLMSPGAQSPAAHLSRTQSETQLNALELSKVPSYTQAVKKSGDEDSEALSPAYEPPLPGSNINLAQVNRNYEEYAVQRPKTPVLVSRGSSSMNLRTLLRAGSGGTSPAGSTNVSLTNLESLGSERLPKSGSLLSLHNLHFMKKKG